VHYTLHKGEIMGIVGESGSGKTVEASTVMGLLPANACVTSGNVLFEGRELLDLTERQRVAFRGKEAGMIFQNPMTSLNPVYTIGRQLTEALLVHDKAMTKKEAHERAVQMLTHVGINQPEQRMKQYPYQLSGGMRQRVMIAMGILCHPKLLIADEPTTALDVTIQAQILDLIHTLRQETGMAVLFITHNLGVVAEICDSVTVMYAGQVVEQGDVREVFYNTKHPYTQGLLTSMPSLEGENHRLTAIPGNPVNLLELGAGCPFAERCTHCMPICRAKKPPERTFAPGHMAACWLNEPNAVRSLHQESAQHNEGEVSTHGTTVG
jgi:oligopeptide transport system ATP-binding protein